jgi:hypothetical protein
MEVEEQERKSHKRKYKDSSVSRSSKANKKDAVAELEAQIKASATRRKELKKLIELKQELATSQAEENKAQHALDSTVPFSTPITGGSTALIPAGYTHQDEGGKGKGGKGGDWGGKGGAWGGKGGDWSGKGGDWGGKGGDWGGWGSGWGGSSSGWGGKGSWGSCYPGWGKGEGVKGSSSSWDSSSWQW